MPVNDHYIMTDDDAIRWWSLKNGQEDDVATASYVIHRIVYFGWTWEMCFDLWTLRPIPFDKKQV